MPEFNIGGLTCTTEVTGRGRYRGVIKARGSIFWKRCDKVHFCERTYVRAKDALRDAMSETNRRFPEDRENGWQTNSLAQR